MAPDRVSIKLTRRELEAVRDAYTDLLIDSAFPADAAHALVHELARELGTALHHRLGRSAYQQRFTIHLTPAHALAFVLTWSQTAPLSLYAHTIILRIIAAVDQQAKSAAYAAGARKPLVFPLYG